MDAAAMHAAGYAFYQVANGAWQTGYAPPDYLSGGPRYGKTSTYPSVPCTPDALAIADQAECCTPTTAGRPYSRAITAPWGGRREPAAVAADLTNSRGG